MYSFFRKNSEQHNSGIMKSAEAGSTLDDLKQWSNWILATHLSLKAILGQTRFFYDPGS